MQTSHVHVESLRLPYALVLPLSSGSASDVPLVGHAAVQHLYDEWEQVSLFGGMVALDKMKQLNAFSFLLEEPQRAVLERSKKRLLAEASFSAAPPEKKSKKEKKEKKEKTSKQSKYLTSLLT